MEFMTKAEIHDPGFKIGYDDSIMFLGSCFAADIGKLIGLGRIKSMVNPMGVQYNPFSVAQCIDKLLSGRLYTIDDIYKHEGRYLSFSHDTSFSSRSAEKILDKINQGLESASRFMQSATLLTVTFGTSWFFRLKETGEIVSNCHKIPAIRFTREMAEPVEMEKRWRQLMEKLHDFNPRIRIIFTVSPVRHLKDGTHGNQLSKAALLILTRALTRSSGNVVYFPSYEIMLDELRDYRFYKDDMVHPSTLAVRHILERFTETYFTRETRLKFNEVSSFTTAMSHRMMSDDKEDRKTFASAILKKAETLKMKYPGLDLSSEIDFFTGF